MVRYSLLLLFLNAYLCTTSGKTICNTSSVVCTDRTSHSTSSLNLYCHILNNDTQLIKTQLNECSGNSTHRYLYVNKAYNSDEFGPLKIDVDLPSNILSFRLFNYRDDHSISLTTSVANSVLTGLAIYESANIESKTFFKNFTALRHIYLQKMITDETPSFTHLKSLTTIQGLIEVSGDPILDENMVSGLENLIFLILDHSNFEKVTPNAFQNLSALQVLSLEYNKITQIQNGTFGSLAKLRRLYLIGNGIVRVSDDAFKGLDQLEILQLDRNPNFPINTLLNTRNLEFLSLNYNNYSTFEPYVFQQMNKLEELSIGNNPFICDCNLKWASKLEEYGVIIIGSCSLPHYATGTSLTDPSIYFRCPQTESFKCFDRSIECQGHEFCHNTGDSYTCGCKKGYVRHNSGECIEDDECTRPNKCEYSCVNTDGSYYCNCSEGFQISANGYSCEDINECQNANGGCELGCGNTVGSYQCYCEFGHRTNNGFNCSVNNEFLMIKEQLNVSITNYKIQNSSFEMITKELERQISICQSDLNSAIAKKEQKNSSSENSAIFARQNLITKILLSSTIVLSIIIGIETIILIIFIVYQIKKVNKINKTNKDILEKSGTALPNTIKPDAGLNHHYYAIEQSINSGVTTRRTEGSSKHKDNLPNVPGNVVLYENHNRFEISCLPNPIYASIK